MGRTAPLNSKRCILYIYSTNIGTEYFKHALYSPFFCLQNAVCFIMLTCLVPVLFTFYIQDVLKLKKIIPAPKLTKIFRGCSCTYVASESRIHLCPAFLVIIFVRGNIEVRGGGGGNRGRYVIRSHRKQPLFIAVEPFNVYQSTHTYFLLAALIFPK